MPEGFQVSKVTLCVKIIKWQSLTQGRYRAARAAKKTAVTDYTSLPFFCATQLNATGFRVVQRLTNTKAIQSFTNAKAHNSIHRQYTISQLITK